MKTRWIDCHGLVRFLSKNTVDLDWYGNQLKIGERIPRFLRRNRWLGCCNALDDEIAQSWSRFVKDNGGYRVGWDLGEDEIWAFDHERTVSNHDAYVAGFVTGIDLASIVAVHTLNPQPGEKVLDLCCAPGAKFGIIADRMQQRGVLVGVDAHKQRLVTTRGLAKQYRWARYDTPEPWDCRIYQGRGNRFGTEPMELVWDSHLDWAYFSKYNHKPRTRIPRRLQERVKARREEAQDPTQPWEGQFDRVIVDTQCTHEGSMRHMLNHFQEIHDDNKFSMGVLDQLFGQWANEMDELKLLQQELIDIGFQNVKPGGTLVYSTCSFCKAQNEEIVSFLLKKYDRQVALRPIKHEQPMRDVENADTIKSKLVTSCDPICIESPIVAHTYHFNPSTSSTSGLFLAAFQKF